MANIPKVPEHTMHVEEQHISLAVPEGVKVEGGLLLDAGDKNELHLKVAKDGRVRTRTPSVFHQPLTEPLDCTSPTAIEQSRRSSTMVFVEEARHSLHSRLWCLCHGCHLRRLHFPDCHPRPWVADESQHR